MTAVVDGYRSARQSQDDAPTLFDVEPQDPPRARKRPRRAPGRPTWTRHQPKEPRRCDECVSVAFETSPAPMLPIRKAAFSRRHGGETRLYCYAHAAAQREQDATEYGLQEKAS